MKFSLGGFNFSFGGGDKRSRPAPKQGLRLTRGEPSSEVGAVVWNAGAGPQYFEALRSSEARTRILTAQFMAASDISRRELALLSRALFDNSGHAALAVEQLAQYCAPVHVKAATEDRDWNEKADAIFAAFCESCDFYGRPDVDFAALQREASVGMDLDGDRPAIFTTASGFPQIQMVDGHRLSDPKQEEGGPNIESGIELDKAGRAVAYHIETDDDTFERIPAAAVFLLRDNSPGAPRRGISPLRRGLNDLRDARDILGAEKSAVKNNAAMPGWVKGIGTEDPKEEFETDEDGNLPPKAEDLPDKVARVDLTGNDVLILEDGREYVPVEPNRPNAQFDSFMDILIGAFASGLGIPPSFFLDTKLTGPGVRLVIGKAQRRFDSRQSTFGRFARWAYVRVIAWAIESGKLEPIEGWTRSTVQFPARLTIDLGDEAAADREAVKLGLMTRAEYFAKRQKDWDDEFQQSATEDRRLIEELKIIAKDTGVPLETLLAKYGFANPNPNAGKDGKGDKPKP